MTATDGKSVDRINSLFSLWLVLLAAGISSNLCLDCVGIIVVLITLEGRANNDHALVVRLGCIGGFVIGLMLVVIGWRMKRRAHRFAEQNHIQYPKEIRIRCDAVILKSCRTKRSTQVAGWPRI